jgi:hypothetical protein
LGVEIWDARANQVDARFRQNTGTTYPLLLQGSSTASQYIMGRDRYIVIDHRGIVRYRTPATGRLGTSFDDMAIRSAITTSLDELKMALQADAQAAADMESGGDMTAVLAETAVPGSFALIGNYPNPFNANTEIRLQLAKAGPVALNIYDVQGRLVRGLWSGLLAAGAHQLSWDGRDEAGRAAATGIFLYRLQSVGQSETRKMLLLR